MKVLVAGGAGYIGSTICSALEEGGHTPIILDSLVFGQEAFAHSHRFYKGDISDGKLLKKIWDEVDGFDCVIHLAAFISVPESVEKPYDYYRENIEKAICFFHNLLEVGCRNIIFSSSASVYGNSKEQMVTEDHPVSPESPYARTKVMTEEILKDFSYAYGMNVIALRYFNPIGVDPKFRSGSYRKNPSHLLGVLLKAYKEGTPMTITGTDWSTRDGSGIRDYIHVWDLAVAHVSAVEKVICLPDVAQGSHFEVINIGRGEGITVKEFVKAFEDAANVKLEIKEGPAREGDVVGAYAICDKARKMLGWDAKLSIHQGIQDAIAWEEKKG